jgi:putative phosphoribosyl transferase
LHSWAVRKLAHPSNPELALGAIGPGGVQIWDEPFGRLDDELRQQLVAEQERELRRRQQLYGDPGVEALRSRPLIVVDDGVATGLTVRAAIQSLRAATPRQLVLAVPVIDRQVAQQLNPQVDELVALATVEDLWAVGSWYQQFETVNDQQVIAILGDAHLCHRR